MARIDAHRTYTLTMVSRLTNLVGWLGVALVFAAFALRFLKPDMQKVWWNLAAAGLVCVLIYILGQWREFMAFFSGRQARYGSLSVASVALVLGILFGLNYIATRQNKRWDLTSNQEFTLSDQTKKVLTNLKEPLQMHVFAKENDFGRFRDKLAEYEYSSKQVKIDYIDPDKEPETAKKFEIQSYGTVAVDYHSRIERVTNDTEQDLTNAIIKAVEGQQKKVYFTQGHGEHETSSADERTGYNNIAAAIGRENFGVEKLALAQNPTIPADASVIVVAGPRKDFLQPEIDAMKGYLNHGGKVLFMIDPPEGADAAPLTNLTALVKEWGFDLGDNIVIDTSGIGQLVGRGPGMPVAISYPQHPITERFGNVMTGFPLARSVTPAANPPQGRTPQTIVETSAQSWAETDIKAIFERRPVKFDEGTGDKKGPVSLAAALSVTAPEQPAAPTTPQAGTNGANGTGPNATPPTPPADSPKRDTRIVVFGDSDFVANSGLGVPGNGDLFLNSVNWLAQQENLISIRPKATEDRRVTLTQEQQFMVFLFSVVFLPGMIVIGGIVNWWRRR
jgi:ABC-type uncharacterized transport system involved in gliding motility auxiliary subunit